MAAHFYSLEDLSHDTKLAEALGNMVVAWADAEQRLLGTLARITGTGQGEYCKSRREAFEIGFSTKPLDSWRLVCEPWQNDHGDFQSPRSHRITRKAQASESSRRSEPLRRR